MRSSDADRPFADHANRVAHMPWTLPGYQPIVQRPSVWRRIGGAFRVFQNFRVDSR